MNSSQQAAASDNKKYGKKLAGFTLLTTLVVVVIVFAAVLYGGDYIKFLDWLEEKKLVDNRYSFHIHSMNPVGVQNMRNIIQHNGWKEVYI